MSGIDLAPIINLSVQIAEVIVPIAIPAVVGWAVQRWGANQSAQQRQVIQDRLTAIAEKAAQAALNHAGHEALSAGPMSTGNAHVDAFGNYMVAQAPDLLKASGIDVSSAAAPGMQDLERMALARLPASVTSDTLNDISLQMSRGKP